MKKKRILIVKSTYYRDICDALFKETIKAKKKYNFSTKNVSGAFEIPLAISKNIKKYDGFIAIGCIVKGETDHYKLISKSVFSSLIYLMINYKKPIANAILTVNTRKQAKIRVFKKAKESINAINSLFKL